MTFLGHVCTWYFCSEPGCVTLVASVDVHDMGKRFSQTSASSSVKCRVSAGLNTLKLRKAPNTAAGT